MASAQIAIPLSPSQESLLTSSTVVLFAFASYLFAHQQVKSEEICKAFVLIVIFSFVVEAVGVHTGFPFGRYQYTHRLWPRLLHVPIIVPLAWFGLALTARETARHLVKWRPTQWLAGGLLVTAYDLFLDPQMIHSHFWVWQTASWWQGAPFSNYVGWLGVATVLMALLDLLLGSHPSNRWLVGLYGWMVGMSTLGFLLPFAFDRPVVGLVGGACTLPFVVLALARKRPSWLTLAS